MPKKKTAKKKTAKKRGAKKASKRTPKRRTKATKQQETVVRPPSTLPPKGQRQWAAVYGNAKTRFLQQGLPEKEAKNAAARQAWCVVKRYYHQGRGGQWILRRIPIAMDKYPPGCGPARAANPMQPSVGDRVRFTEGPTGQTGRVENRIRSTYWVRMDADKSLVATHGNNVELVERGEARRSGGAKNNPSEEVVNAAYRYVAALDNLQGAMQLGNRKDVREARRLVNLAEKNLLDAAGAPSPIGAALAAAVGGGLGALAGPAWAALGSGVGSFIGSTLGGVTEEQEQQIPVLETGRKAPGPVIMGGAVGTRPMMVPEPGVEEPGRRRPATPIATVAAPRGPRVAPQPGRRGTEEAETTPAKPKKGRRRAARRAPPQPPARPARGRQGPRRGPVAVPTPESTPEFELLVGDDDSDFAGFDDEVAVGNPGKIRRLKNSLLK